MIDALVILFSVGMSLVVAFRALRLDAVLPWFGPEAPPPEATQPAAGPAVERGWRARRRGAG